MPSTSAALGSTARSWCKPLWTAAGSIIAAADRMAYAMTAETHTLTLMFRVPVKRNEIRTTGAHSL